MDLLFRDKNEQDVKNDIYTTLALREAVLKEGFMQETELRIVKGVLRKCLVTEGENRYMVCSHLMQQYMDLLRQPRITGYVNIDAPKGPDGKALKEVENASHTRDYMRKRGMTVDASIGK